MKTQKLKKQATFNVHFDFLWAGNLLLDESVEKVLRQDVEM